MRYEYRCETLPFIPGKDAPAGPEDGRRLRPTAEVLTQLGAEGWRVVYAERENVQASRLNPDVVVPLLVVLLERRVEPPEVGYPRVKT